MYGALDVIVGARRHGARATVLALALILLRDPDLESFASGVLCPAT